MWSKKKNSKYETDRTQTIVKMSKKKKVYKAPIKSQMQRAKQCFLGLGCSKEKLGRCLSQEFLLLC